MMDNLVGVLIMVLPGIIGYYVAQKIGPAENRQISDYEKTVTGLLFNIPGLSIYWMIIWLYYHKQVSFSELNHDVMYMPSFFIYITFVVIFAVLSAFVWDRVGRHITRIIINKRRHKSKRPMGSDKTPWEAFIGHERSGFMRIYPIGERGKFVFGEINNVFVPGDQDKGVFLTATEQLIAWDGWFDSPARTYVDTISKMVYEIYPTHAWDDAKRRVADYKANLSS